MGYLTITLTDSEADSIVGAISAARATRALARDTGRGADGGAEGAGDDTRDGSDRILRVELSPDVECSKCAIYGPQHHPEHSANRPSGRANR